MFSSPILASKRPVGNSSTALECGLYKGLYLTTVAVLLVLLLLGLHSLVLPLLGLHSQGRPCDCSKDGSSRSGTTPYIVTPRVTAPDSSQAAAAVQETPTPAPPALPAPPAKKDASIIVVVTTKASSKDRRSWLRNQFKRNVELLRQKDPSAADAVVFRFALGSLGLSDEHRNWTRTEQKEHGDLLMLDIIDTNTPDPPPDGVETATALKVVHSAIWAVDNYNFPWFVRLGDDSYFRVDHFLLNVASTLSKTKLVFGYAEDPQLGWSFSHGVSIKRYCSGMGFILTYDVTKYVSDNAANLYKGYPEDAVVGLWFAGTNFKTQHDMRLHDWVWKRCSNESIIIHKHDYKDVPEDGIMSSCFPNQKQL